MALSLDYLFGRYLDKTITPFEKEAFIQLLRQPGYDEELQKLIDRSILERDAAHVLSEETAASILQAIFQSEAPSLATAKADLAGADPGEADFAGANPAEADRRKAALMRPWRRWAAAALVLLAAGSILYLAKEHQEPLMAVRQPKLDIKPGGNRATLTLADGTTIDLESAGKGMLTRQGSALVQKTDSGQLAYAPETAGPAGAEGIKGAAGATGSPGASGSEGTKQDSILYNMISTPRGGQYQVVLPDGTKVWLNAASSLRFPTAFTGKERQVELTGEGYFAVAKDTRRPFVVSFNHMEVQVLGTGFDIMAYSDEPVTQTTLAEGSIRLVNGPAHTLLEPNKTATVADGSIKVTQADVQQVTAWMSGEWSFNDVEIPVIMRQLCRWYDVDVSYQGKIPEGTVGGVLSRNVNLSTVLKFLQSTGIHLRQDGRKITILP